MPGRGQLTREECLQYDKARIGEIEYMRLMEDVLDEELLALYKGTKA